MQQYALLLLTAISTTNYGSQIDADSVTYHYHDGDFFYRQPQPNGSILQASYSGLLAGYMTCIFTGKMVEKLEHTQEEHSATFFKLREIFENQQIALMRSKKPTPLVPDFYGIVQKSNVTGKAK